MKKTPTRVVATLLGFAILVSSLGAATFPKRADAFVFVDPTNLVQNTISAVSNAADHVKDYILDTLIWQVGNLAIQSLTKSLVNWINSGFQGSPAFVTDLKGNLQGIGDAVARKFFEELAKEDIATTPFQDKVLDAVRLGYYLHTSPESFYTKNPYTLNQVSANDKAFLAGDFSQGGWNAWYSAALSLPNNPYGSEILANDALTTAVSSATGGRLQELSWNRGFLSWRGECTAQRPGAEDEVVLGQGAIDAGAAAGISLSNEDPCASYEIETPGSVIMEQLNHQLGTGVNRLVSADEINEIVGALLNQLVIQVVGGGSGGGLRGVSRPATGGGSSYIDQATSPSQVESAGIANTFAATVTRQRQEIIRYQDAWERIRAVAETAERCTNATPNPTEVKTRAAAALVTAVNALAALDAIQAEITAANAAGGNQSQALLTISQRYNTLASSGTLPSPEAIAEASSQSVDTGNEEPASLYSQLTRIGNSPTCSASGT